MTLLRRQLKLLIGARSIRVTDCATLALRWRHFTAQADEAEGRRVAVVLAVMHGASLAQ